MCTCLLTLLKVTHFFLLTAVLNFKQTPLCHDFPHIERPDFLLKRATHGKLTSPNKLNESDLQSKGPPFVTIFIIV